MMYAIHTYVDNLRIRTDYYPLKSTAEYIYQQRLNDKSWQLAADNIEYEFEETREFYRAIKRAEICAECGKNYIQYNQTVYCIECIKTVELGGGA